MQPLRNLESINHDLTPEVMSKVDDVITEHKGKPGCLIPVLEECQTITGYLPVELQEYIAYELNIPGSAVYGVVTFYSFFSMVPKGRHTVKACMGTACYVRGMGEVLNRIQSTYNLHVGGTGEDRRFSLESVRCIGACGLAPVIMVDKDTHGGMAPDKVKTVLDQYE